MVKSTNIRPVKDCRKCLLNSISKIVIINIAQETFLYFANHEMYNRMRGIYNEKNQGSLHYPDGVFFKP